MKMKMVLIWYTLILTLIFTNILAKLSFNINQLNHFNIAKIDIHIFDTLHVDMDLDDDTDLQNMVEFSRESDLYVMTNKSENAFQSLEDTLEIINIESIFCNEQEKIGLESHD